MLNETLTVFKISYIGRILRTDNNMYSTCFRSDEHMFFFFWSSHKKHQNQQATHPKGKNIKRLHNHIVKLVEFKYRICSLTFLTLFGYFICEIAKL